MDVVSKWLNMALMLGFYGIVILLELSGALAAWMLLVFLAIPRLIELLKIFRRPKPSQPPEDYPVWPLWFVSWAFYHHKHAGTLLVLGLARILVFPISRAL